MIKKTNKIISDKVLCYPKKVKEQRVQKAIREATKSKEFDGVKRTN